MRSVSGTVLALGLAACLSGVLVLPDPALAQQPATAPRDITRGLLTTQLFKETPAQPAISVSPYDDSDLNLTLKADFEAEIVGQERGRVERAGAADYLLLFESEVMPAEAVPQGPSLGSAEVTDEGVDVNVNVWSSEKDSILGGRQESAEVDSSVFHINAVLRERASSTVAWQGDAYYRLTGPATESVARAMIAPLVRKLGQAGVREAFEIR